MQLLTFVQTPYTKYNSIDIYIYNSIFLDNCDCRGRHVAHMFHERDLLSCRSKVSSLPPFNHSVTSFVFDILGKCITTLSLYLTPRTDESHNPVIEKHSNSVKLHLSSLSIANKNASCELVALIMHLVNMAHNPQR